MFIALFKCLEFLFSTISKRDSPFLTWNYDTSLTPNPDCKKPPEWNWVCSHWLKWLSSMKLSIHFECWTPLRWWQWRRRGLGRGADGLPVPLLCLAGPRDPPPSQATPGNGQAHQGLPGVRDPSSSCTLLRSYVYAWSCFWGVSRRQARGFRRVVSLNFSYFFPSEGHHFQRTTVTH